MPDWMTPPRLLLLAVPIAMALAAGALGAGERRARARRLRQTLGRPQKRVDHAAAGEAVVLEGRIEIAEEPCARFEDGARVAVATVESSGIRALRGDLRWRLDPDDLPRVAHSARAGFVELAVGSERVVLAGPIEVLVGSEETDPEADFEALGAAVRERIAAEVYPASLPSAGALDPVHARPLFRSVRAGDRVWAAGVLARHSDGVRTGYREPAQWALSGPAHRPVVLAYDGAPRHRGVVASALRGVRRFSWLRAALAVAVLASSVVALAFLSGRSGGRARASGAMGAAVAPSSQGRAHPHFGAASECAALKKQHDAAVEKASACAADVDCAVETRGGVYFDLEGCYRYRNRGKQTESAAAIETDWLDEGCATSYEICPAAPVAMCRDGRCVERPPAPVPETWHREDVPGGFFLYLPPETRRVPAQGVDSIVAHYRGGGVDLISDFGDYGVEMPGTADVVTVKIGGYDARVWKQPRQILVYFEQGKACGPPRCRYGEAGEKLALHATCDTEEACAAAWVALQSTRFW